MNEVKKNQSLIPILFLLLLLSLPVIVFIANSGVQDFFRVDAPNGQLMYLASKLFGLCAFMLLWWQLCVSLLAKWKKTESLFTAGKTFHIVLGSSLLVLMLLHSGLFVSAVSSRAGHIAWHLLVPNFSSGYYTSAVSLGVLALFVTLIAVSAGIFRKHFSGVWRKGHALVFLVIVLVFFHAYQIGSELQSSLFQPVFWLAVGSLAVAIVSRIFINATNQREL